MDTESLSLDPNRGPNPYRPITPEIVAELTAIVGEQHVIYSDRERMADYAHDEEFGAGHVCYYPDVVVRPDGAEQIAAIMRLANRERIPVTPRGAGSGLSGGAVPIYGGILLSTERMNRILEIDLANMVAVVEPGVITNDLDQAARQHGLFYAGYPMSVETCSLGGNVAENAGGGRAIKYGVTSRYVLGLEVVLPTGEIVQLGGKRLKDVTGYDLLHLMVGSEGTLGIFTKIILRLIPMPRARAVILVPFPDLASAIAAVPPVMMRSGLIPSAIEFMDRLGLQIAYDFVKEKPPRPDIGALLLIEVDGFSQEEVAAQVDTIVDLCMEAGALDAYIGDTPAMERRMWRPRQKLAEALSTLYQEQSGEDLVVPLSQIPALLPLLERLAKQYRVLTPCFGHVGDGNVHVHLIRGPDLTSEEWHAQYPAMMTDLYTAVAGLGGTISGEHGIGSKRARYLPLVLDAKVIELQRQIKAIFDPLNILNPGKIFPPTSMG